MIGKIFKTASNSAGESGGLNIFAQSNEPTTKEGLWINTSATGSLPEISNFEYEGVEISCVDYYNDKDIEYTYTQLTNIPYNFYSGSAVAVGTDIYLFGSAQSSSYYKYAYKYNISTNTYTKLTNIPYNFYSGSAVAVGTDVYLFGSSNSTYYKYAYKYNISTNTYTKLTDIPYNFYSGSAVAVGTDVYLLGGSGGYTKLYKYITVELNENYIYLCNSVELFEVKLLDNSVIKIYNTFIYKDCLLQNYPAYYGDGTQWNLLPN